MNQFRVTLEFAKKELLMFLFLRVRRGNNGDLGVEEVNLELNGN